MIAKTLSIAAILIAGMSSASADYSSPIFKDLDVRGVVKLPGTGYPYANAGGSVTYSTTIPNSGLAFSSITIAGHIVALGGTQAIACGDLSDGATGCATAIGTSGATLPLLSTANTWTLAQTYSAAPIFTTLNGYLKANGAGALTASSTLPSADFADGNTGTGAVAHATSPSFTTLSASGQFTSTVATGTPPFVVSSASKVINLYSDRAALADTVTTNANLTGDVTSVGNATTIAANSVTNAKAAQMAATSFKCNNTGSTANAIDCTASQATAMLNAFAGDSGSGGVKGLVPPPAAGDAAAGKVLGASGGWVAPSAVSAACPAGVICITTYGADPTGVSDSASAVQAAVNAALAQPHGGEVFVPAVTGGCYKIGAQVSFPATAGKTVIFRGTGEGSCFVNAAALDSTAMFYVGAATPSGGTGFVARDVSVRGRTPTTGKAFELNNANGAEFYGVHFASMNWAISMANSHGVIFDHNQWETMASYCVVSSTEAHHTVFTKNKFYNTGSLQCIFIGGFSVSVVVRDNDAEVGTTFFSMAGGGALTFEGNYFEIFSETVFYLSSPAYGGCFCNNYITTSGTVSLSNSDSFSANNNYSLNQTLTAGTAVLLRAHGNRNSGTGSTIADTSP